MGIALAFIVAAIAFAFTLVITPLYIYSARQKGILGRDVNKPGKPEVAELGGFALFGGMVVAILSGVLIITFLDKTTNLQAPILAALACLTIIALVGVFDWFFRLTWRTKTVMPVVSSLPLVAVKAGQSIVSLPLLGTFDFGLLYNFIIVPLGVTGASNAVNMSAGYNGLEAGIAVITSLPLLYISLITGAVPSTILLAAMLGASLGFLRYNWFPAKVFPGDVGTLVIGATLASAVILGNMERFGVIVIIPAFYELVATVYYGLKGVYRRGLVHSPILKDGKIIPPKGTGNFTLPFKLLSLKNMGERDLVLSMLAIYAFFGLVALAAFHLAI